MTIGPAPITYAARVHAGRVTTRQIVRRGWIRRILR